MSSEQKRPSAGAGPRATGEAASASGEGRTDRRTALGAAAAVAMGGSLAVSYGSFGYFAGRFLYPARPIRTSWLFVTTLEEMKKGDSREYRSPLGEKVSVARQGDQGDVSDFIALSSTCPHLGCQVHWEGQNNRFFCPCHNGIFDPSGKGIGGPPGEAGQDLPRFDLKVENGMLFIEVQVEGLADASAADAGQPSMMLAARTPGGVSCSLARGQDQGERGVS